MAGAVRLLTCHAVFAQQTGSGKGGELVVHSAGRLLRLPSHGGHVSTLKKPKDGGPKKLCTPKSEFRTALQEPAFKAAPT